MKSIYFVEESFRNEEPALDDNEISTLVMCLAAIMTLIVLIQVSIFC